jgi:hypothetical protein
VDNLEHAFLLAVKPEQPEPEPGVDLSREERWII